MGEVVGLVVGIVGAGKSGEAARVHLRDG
jgi:hypothetical protein